MRRVKGSQGGLTVLFKARAQASNQLTRPSISNRNYAREEHVDFQEIAREAFGMDDYHPLRAMYRRIRAKVPDADEPGLVYTGTFSSPFSEYEELGVAGLRIGQKESGVNLDWTPSRMWYENLWVVLCSMSRTLSDGLHPT